MKQFIINKTIESEVELMISLARQVQKLKKDYPECWKLLAKEFQVGDFINRDFIQDDEENIKISLYAGIIRMNAKNEQSKLNNITFLLGINSEREL